MALLQRLAKALRVPRTALLELSKKEESYASKASGSAKSTHEVEAKQAGPQEH
jgi:hypothetical protein